MSQSKYRNSILYHVVYCELISAARHRGLTTYQAIAQIMGLPLKGSHMGKEVGQILGEIVEDEVAQGRPMLSAVAVGVSNQPGPGFYTLAHELGRLSDVEDQDKEAYWRNELHAVYQTWVRKF